VPGLSAHPSYDPPVRTGGEAALEQRIPLALPRDTIWAALRDPALIASCVPGAGVTEMSGDRIAGTLQAGLGPIRARFTGQGTLSYDSDRFAGYIAGEGSDATTGTRLQAHIDFQVEAVDDAGSVLVLSVRYGLRGALAQFARGPLVRAFAAEIAAQTGANLERRLTGDTEIASPQAGSLLLRSFWRWLRALAGR